MMAGMSATFSRRAGSGSTVPPRILLALAVAGVLALTGAGCAVTPSATFQHSTFEGFEVISYVPENPRGVAYVFHGTNGSAALVEKVESVDVLNRLIARGYGFVATSSTERTGNKRWNVFDATLGNPDLARMARLQAHIVNTTGATAATPLLGIGMSNGARFVTLWGEFFKDGGFPVKAIWASHGNTAPYAQAPGALTVPTVFSTSVNDFTVPPGEVIIDFSTARDAGTPTELYVSQERRLSASRYERIPGIDATEAGQIVSALKATGVWNAQGDRIVGNIEQAVTQARTVNLPASVRPHRNDIEDQTALQLAVHQFTAEFGPQAEAFFSRYAPPR